MSTQSNSRIRFVFVVLAALVLGLTFALPTSSQAADQIVWRMDHWLMPQDIETKMLEQACDEILKYTEGRLKIDVYPGFSLKLNPRTQLRNIRDGLCEAACMNAEMLEGMEPSFAVTEAPGVWASKADQAKAVEALIPFKKRVYSEVWKSHYVASRMLSVQINGLFFAKKPVKTLDDLRGLKIRIPSRRQMEPFKALGAAPQTMPPGEVYMALKTGVLDGASSGSRTLIYFKWGEVVDYALEGPFSSAVAQEIAVNQKAWDALPDDIQEIVTMVFTALAQKQEAMAVMPGMSNHYRRVCEGTMDVTYYDMSPQDLEKYRQVFANKWYKDLEKADPRTKEAWNIVKQFTIQ